MRRGGVPYAEHSWRHSTSNMAAMGSTSSGLPGSAVTSRTGLAAWSLTVNVTKPQHSCSAAAREASSACAPELGQTGLRRPPSCAMAVMCWGGLRGAFLQLADDVGEHLRHLVVRAELDHPDSFLDDNGVA